MSKEVATVKETNTALATGGFDYGEMSREGFEDTKITDLSIPFINILQPMSPEITEDLIPGVKIGDMLNSVTKEIVSQPIYVVPIEMEHLWVEWVPRNKGGGLVDRHDPNSEIVNEAIRKNGNSRIPPKGDDGKRIPFKSPKGNDLIETHYVYCLLLNEDDKIEGFCVLSFTSTKIKVFKDWKTSMFMIKGAPPIYAIKAKVETKKEKSDGGTYFNYQISAKEGAWSASLIPPVGDGLAILEEARRMRDMIRQGLARADLSGAEAAANEEASIGSGSASDQTSGRKVADDDEIPF